MPAVRGASGMTPADGPAPDRQCLTPNACRVTLTAHDGALAPVSDRESGENFPKICLLSPDGFETTCWSRWLRSPVLSPVFPAGCVYRDNVLRPCYNLGSIKADYKHANARPRFTGLRRLPAAPTWSFRVERTCLPRPWRGFFLPRSRELRAIGAEGRRRPRGLPDLRF